MNSLFELWQRRLRVFLANLAEGEREYREIASLAREISRDYSGRFFIELLQNAADQAIQGGIEDSTVTIIRTSNLFTVGNAGLPFGPEGIDRLTSIGVSLKDAAVNIGNKGIGFKAVYQVTASPEIYSADPEKAGRLGAGVTTMFQMVKGPFADFRLQNVLRDLLASLPSSDATTFERLKSRLGLSDLVESVLNEARKSAPFKFPLPLESKDFEQRIGELEFSREALAEISSLIVLPLLPEPAVDLIVDKALDEFVGENGADASEDLPGSGLLFLRGVGRLLVCDRKRGFVREVSRTITKSGRPSIIRTGVRTVGAEAVGREWWSLSCILGEESPSIDKDAAQRQQAEIRAAASALEGDSWKDVRTAKVAVALPKPRETDIPGRLLGPRGLICIGLPTLDPSGTPIWVDAHFSGTISRKGIDLVNIRYNEILFNAAVELATELISLLKQAPDINAKRAATLALEPTKGPLFEKLWAAGGPAGDDVVLAADGQDFLRPRDLALPAEQDKLVFYDLAAAADEEFLGNRGFRLPDRALLENARSLLDRLGAPVAGNGQPLRPYLDRPLEQKSLLEQAAIHHRRAGSEFWEPFATWLTERFQVDQLKDQRILPVAGAALASPESRVFLRRMDGVASGDDEEEVDVGQLSESLKEALHFLDEAAIRIVQADGRTRTPLARKLAPDSGGGLVRRPRIDELMNQVLAPQLADASGDPSKRDLALLLLRQAISWIREIGALERVQLGRLRVPTLGESKNWIWRDPTTVYFGKGWLHEAEEGLEIDSLLESAYGQVPARRLVPWEVFAGQLALSEGDRAEWFEGLERMGVTSEPRIRDAARRMGHPLFSVRTTELSRDPSVACPFPGLEESWLAYLEDIRHRPSRTTSGQRFDVEALCWIDGLENEASREAVFDLMLRKPKRYEARAATRLQRADGQGDSTTVPTLWVHAMRTAGWAIVPASLGGGPRVESRLPPRKVWRLDVDQRRKSGMRLLNAIPGVYDDASSLLKTIGVQSLAEAGVEELINALQELADTLKSLPVERQRDARSLTHELYARVQHLCSGSQTGVDLSPVLRRPMPLLHGNQLRPVALADPEVVIYLSNDPDRELHILNWDTSLKLPISSRTRYTSLVEALRSVLGRDRLLVTSEATVSTGFQIGPGQGSVPILQYLEEKLHNPKIALDLALLVAYAQREDDNRDNGTGEAASIAGALGRDFQEEWDRIKSAHLQVGTFPPDSQTNAFYDSRENMLQADIRLDPWGILRECSRLVPNQRDAWLAYSSAREKDAGSVGSFFSERSIGDIEIEQVEEALGYGDRRFLDSVKPCFLAAWTKHHSPQKIGIFLSEWETRAKAIPSMAAWMETEGLENCLHDLRASRPDEVHASITLLSVLGVSFSEWQNARQTLGFSPHLFEISRDRFRRARERLAFGLKSLAAHTLSVDLGTARHLIETLRDVSVPRHIEEAPPEDEAILRSVMVQALKMWSATPQRDLEKMSLLGVRIAALRTHPPSGFDGVWVEGATQREEDLYRELPDPLRESQARQDVDGILQLAIDLAPTFQELIQKESVFQDQRLQSLTEDWWANKYAALAALRDRLDSIAPKTVEALTERRAFHGASKSHELRATFPQLRSSTPKPAATVEEAKIRVLGQELKPSEINSDLLSGSAGLIGTALGVKADAGFDFSRFRRHRQPAQRVERIRTPSTRPRGSSGQPSQSRELDGLLGEAFLYEIFRKTLRDFDDTCWRSSYRTKYGLAGEGDDSLGYDFQYRDADGKLVGVPDRVCWIECKATTGDGNQPFPMSVNEWDVAADCHHDQDGAVYLICRVARVGENPAIVDLIVDPYGLYRDGIIQTAERDLWVYVGTASK